MMRHPSDKELGVSPIIGVLTFVAVTIVLSATIYIVVSEINPPSERPRFHATVDDRTGKMAIVQATPGLELMDLELRLSVDGRFAYNEAVAAGSTVLPANAFIQVTGTPGQTVLAGDRIEFCLMSEHPQVSVEVRSEGLEIIYQDFFQHLRVCS